jgi:hypothetical protein
MESLIRVCEFLCEFAAIFKNELAHKSVTKVGLIDEKKTGGRKSRETAPLSQSTATVLQKPELMYNSSRISGINLVRPC